MGEKLPRGSLLIWSAGALTGMLEVIHEAII